CLLPAILLLVLYRYELRLVRRTTALALLGLRQSALFFLLFILCLQPVLARTPKEELSSRVLVAVDRSESMDARDPQRSPLGKLFLARALKWSGDLCSDKDLDDWIQGYQEKGAPEWVARDEFPDEPAQRRQLAETRRRQHDRVCQRIDNLTRSEMTQKLLA